MWLNNMSITRKLGFGFAVVLASVAITTGISFVSLDRLRAMSDEDTRSANLLDQLDVAVSHFYDSRSAVRGMILEGTPRQTRLYNEAKSRYDATIAKARDLAGSDQALRPSLDAVDDAAGRWRSQIGDRQADAIVDRQDPALALSLTKTPENIAINDKFRASLDAARDSIGDAATASQAAEEAGYGTLKAILLAGGLAALVAAIAIGWALTRLIARPVAAMTSTMRELARGNHGVVVPALGRKDELGQMADAVQHFKTAAAEKLRIETEARDAQAQADQERAARDAEKAEEAARSEFAISEMGTALTRLSEGDLVYRIATPFSAGTDRLRTRFNATVETLQGTMIEIGQDVLAMKTGSMEMRGAADDLSRRTEQQASSLEQTAAALNEITRAVQRTADGAVRASEVVKSAKGEATQSGEVVRRAVVAMDSIERSSNQIGQIIGVIDEIAFQTSLLALNAGVEAARAGDAGRGFAVVASEVRALAQRSAEAAKEIKQLISSSAAHVGEGVELVGETGAALERIARHVADINEAVAAIASSAQEQSVGLNEVNTAVAQMDDVTQQNAAMVEQSTAASHALSQEADRLAGRVHRFNTGSVLETSRPAAEPARRAHKPAPRPGHARPQQSAALALADDGWTEF